jgi:hypothetical protein
MSKRQKHDDFFEILHNVKVYNTTSVMGDPELAQPPSLFERVKKLEESMERIELQCGPQCCCKLKAE